MCLALDGPGCEEAAQLGLENTEVPDLIRNLIEMLPE
jgi:hypothetical protein